MYAAWSELGVINCTEMIRWLYEQNYNGSIIVIDADAMTADFQMDVFGQVCQGWGEIFRIRNGNICKAYTGKDCFVNFAADPEK